MPVSSLHTIDSMSQLLLKLYSGLEGDRPWSEFLAAMRAEYQAAFGTFILTPNEAEASALILTPDVDQHALDQASEFFSCDPFVDLPEGMICTSAQWLGKMAYRASRYYRDYMAEHHIGDILGVDVVAPSGFQMRLRLTRRDDAPDFTVAEQHALGLFVPHLRAALALYERAQRQRGEDDVYVNALEQLSLGTIVLDRAGSVVGCNAIAQKLLDERDALHLVGRRLAFANPSTDRSFRRALEEPDHSGLPLRFIRAERQSGEEDIGIAIRPLHSRGGEGGHAIFLTDPQRQMALTGKAVAEIFGLTPTEGEIAACFANGLCLSQTAITLGIARNTVRTHLRSIFDKLSVTRQSQLVQRVRSNMSGLVAWAATSETMLRVPPRHRAAPTSATYSK